MSRTAEHCRCVQIGGKEESAAKPTKEASKQKKGDKKKKKKKDFGKKNRAQGKVFGKGQTD